MKNIGFRASIALLGAVVITLLTPMALNGEVKRSAMGLVFIASWLFFGIVLEGAARLIRKRSAS